MEVFFDNIEAKLCQKIIEFDEVVICSAWLSSDKILEAASQINSQVILTEDIKLRIGAAGYDKHLIKKLKTNIQKIYIYHSSDKKLMHNKFIVFLNDNKPVAVATGSYNLTYSASKNYENMIYIVNDDIAQKYYDEFLKIKNCCKQLE